MSRDQSVALCGSLVFAPLIRHFRGCGDCRVAAFFRTLAWLFLDPKQIEGPPEILVEQVDIGVEREARGVVSEPALDLEDVAPFGEESRRDGVAEGVEAGPLDGGLLARRSQHPVCEVVGVKRRPGR